jgi:hypothetical protein
MHRVHERHGCADISYPLHVRVGMILVAEHVKAPPSGLNHGFQSHEDRHAPVFHLFQDRLEDNHVAQGPRSTLFNQSGL